MIDLLWLVDEPTKEQMIHARPLPDAATVAEFAGYAAFAAGALSLYFAAWWLV